ncbi:MAG TPA: choice-of-anchor P family protein [Verrucomicrobiae bacterium]|nr:choice-of-anchor P family protein [Verrucomicrobiae bacterium]
MRTKRRITPLLVPLFVIAAIAGPTGGRAAAAAATMFSGQATVISGQVAGMPITLVDTGPVAASGGHLHKSVLDYPISGLPDPTGGALTAEVLHATVVAEGNKSSAEAVVADFSLSAAGQNISAEFLAARASATCNSGTATITESSEIAGLTVNGTQITVGTQPQTITIPGVGSIAINEQPVASASGDSGAVTVNALHIMLTDPVLGKTDIIVASAHADITCASQPGAGGCDNKDFVTGGGWITGTPSGARANFAVAGADGGWGHFLYTDHGAGGPRAKGTGVLTYTITGPTARHIHGTADIDGVAGTYDVDVADNGEPGHDLDTFALVLSTSYKSGGLLKGGNIQLHCK